MMHIDGWSWYEAKCIRCGRFMQVKLMKGHVAPLVVPKHDLPYVSVLCVRCGGDVDWDGEVR